VGAVATTTRANLIVNSSFESSLVGWSATRSTLSRAALANAPDGKFVAEVTLTKGTSYSINTTAPVVSKTAAGTGYLGYAFVAAAAVSTVGKRVAIVVRETNRAGKVLRLNTSPKVRLAVKSQLLALSFTTLQSGRRLGVQVVEYGAAKGDRIYVDDVQLYDLGATPTSPRITNLPSAPLSGGAFTPVVSTTGDGTRSVNSSTPGICAVASGVVHFVNTGTCTLTAHVTAGVHFLAATGLPQSFVVGRAGSAPAHILLVMEENQGYAATLGSCGSGSPDPYFCSLASSFTSLTSWYATMHPSLPNYLASTSGSTQGCTSDSCAPSLSGNNLGNQLSSAGVPWTAYMESMPTACYSGATSGEYAMKHNPFEYFLDNRSSCHELPYPGAAGVVSSLDVANAPRFVWVTPNLINDMHDGSVRQGDAWLSANLPGILKSTWFTNFRSTVIVTMDENSVQSTGSCCGDATGGRVPMVVISSNAKGRGSVATVGNQYGTLRTIEEAFNLSLLGAASNPANGDLAAYFG